MQKYVKFKTRKQRKKYMKNANNILTSLGSSLRFYKYSDLAVVEKKAPE